MVAQRILFFFTSLYPLFGFLPYPIREKSPIFRFFDCATMHLEMTFGSLNELSPSKSLQSDHHSSLGMIEYGNISSLNVARYQVNLSLFTQCDCLQNVTIIVKR